MATRMAYLVPSGMRARPTLTALALAIALVAAAGGPSSAGMSPAETARRSGVVLRIGTKEVTVGELEDRLASIPRFQLMAMGSNADEIRHKFLTDIIVPEVLIATAAEKQHVDEEVGVQNNIRRALASATMRVSKAQAGTINQISKDEIRKYFTENRAKFDTPTRYAVWRILCAKREDAVEVISAAKAALTVDNFTKLARERSIDKATDLRGGNLGFLDVEGNSNEAGVKVDPAVVKAAAAVKDGELVPQPVPEGAAFAVVWHRGTVPAAHRSPEEAAPQIREAIYRQRMEEATKTEVDQLRHEHLIESNEGVLNGIEISSVDGEVMPRRRPGQVPPLHQIGRSAPKP
jgi:peptidyl-prolyl cis-trans isomerase C